MSTTLGKEPWPRVTLRDRCSSPGAWPARRRSPATRATLNCLGRDAEVGRRFSTGPRSCPAAVDLPPFDGEMPRRAVRPAGELRPSSSTSSHEAYRPADPVERMHLPGAEQAERTACGTHEAEGSRSEQSWTRRSRWQFPASSRGRAAPAGCGLCAVAANGACVRVLAAAARLARTGYRLVVQRGAHQFRPAASCRRGARRS